MALQSAGQKMGMELYQVMRSLGDGCSDCCGRSRAYLCSRSAASICFDSDGGLLFNRKRVPLLEAKYGPESTVAVVLNLDPESPNMNTMSLYRDGQRLADPQTLPESLQGKALFPTLTYKNMREPYYRFACFACSALESSV
ncbi:HNRNPUL1 [Symbiodinium natans]|uniref:HNRNPUL1 protein n=1 Tax=Symbiodinium natans TaxID=878477 RepID=A0A812HMX2_9DINO|nr:HNRNPUL1 [Symbiodinium natans]